MKIKWQNIDLSKYMKDMFTVSAMPIPGATKEDTARATEKMVATEVKRIEAQKGRDVVLINDRVFITDVDDNNNVVPRLNEVRGLDYDYLKDHIDDTIYELLPQPPELPITPPPVSEFVNALWVANWGMLADFGGSTDPDKDIGGDWVRRDAHEWPARFGINPVYRFFTGDNPLFYIHNPVSHRDPETGEDVVPDEITWKLDGQEVHKGRYLQLYEVSPTEARKALTVEIKNSAGTTTQTLFYEIKDSDDEGSIEGFSSTYQGSYFYDSSAADGKGKAIFRADDRYEPRWVKFRVEWNNYGNGENKKRKFRSGTPSVKLDGVELNRTGELGSNTAGNTYSKQNGDELQKDGRWYYFEKSPGPMTLEIDYRFNYRSGGKKRRIFNKVVEQNIALDSPRDGVIDLGVLYVGKRDVKR